MARLFLAYKKCKSFKSLYVESLLQVYFYFWMYIYTDRHYNIIHDNNE